MVQPQAKSNMQVAVGDLVEALYHGNCNGTRWYKQTVVTHVHDDGTVNLGTMMIASNIMWNLNTLK